jgi:hypothetical protein
MNPYRIQLLITALLAVLLTTTASGRPLEFSELSLLVRAHEPEPSLIADAKERKLMHALTPQQEATLKSQGATDSLIQSLRNSKLVVSQSEAKAYEESRSTPTRIPAPPGREGFASRRPNVEIVNVACGYPVNLSYWGGPDYDFTFRSRDIVEVGRPEAEMIQPSGTSIHYATYRGVRVPDWEPVDPEYTSIMSHVYARPVRIDWHNPVLLDDVPYTLYPVYAGGGVALYYIGQSSCDSVMLAIVTRS